MKILIAGGGTGGHLMPALVLADALVSLDASVEPVLVGARRGVEASLLPGKRYRYHLLPLEPIYRRAWWRNLRWPFIVWRALRCGGAVLASERPVLALGTGGYASGPILFQALRLGLPVALQEQNAFPGLATRWLARRASQVHLGFPEAARHLKPGPGTAVLTHGNPIAPPAATAADRSSMRQSLGIEGDRLVLLVTGGSQGSVAINRAVAGLLDGDALKDAVVLWSVGRHSWHDYRRYHSPPQRQVRAFWDPIGEAYAAADLIIARAGAMTTAELCAWGLPAILIPLPGAAANHQTRNAEALAAAGAATHLPESRLTTHRLQAAIEDMLRSRNILDEMGRAARARGRPDAARRIASDLLTLVS
ncbi:MAG: UDP-N-acetylglucosamine--N-acetylmuramyl-(pentapeptide) pyrophosphoryl-undecaprenol N-acetylglucosamine transferase [Gemmatimonadota bacterium]|nr:MAG: UDP-N-acetylglucosamine--N-acetylmuramyl-(pentapeptide) pyrophosphoryl-undecaprenol N-acetylglucosamine transferase [Gemmatimonadota bacterium]